MFFLFHLFLVFLPKLLFAHTEHSNPASPSLHVVCPPPSKLFVLLPCPHLWVGFREGLPHCTLCSHPPVLPQSAPCYPELAPADFPNPFRSHHLSFLLFPPCDWGSLQKSMIAPTISHFNAWLSHPTQWHTNIFHFLQLQMPPPPLCLWFSCWREGLSRLEMHSFYPMNTNSLLGKSY